MKKILFFFIIFLMFAQISCVEANLGYTKGNSNVSTHSKPFNPQEIKKMLTKMQSEPFNPQEIKKVLAKMRSEPFNPQEIKNTLKNTPQSNFFNSQEEETIIKMGELEISSAEKLVENLLIEDINKIPFVVHLEVLKNEKDEMKDVFVLKNENDNFYINYNNTNYFSKEDIFRDTNLTREEKNKLADIFDKYC